MIKSTLSLNRDNGNERVKLPVVGSDNGTQVSGNYTIGSAIGDLPTQGRELWISNDSNSNITFIVTCTEGTLGFLIQPGETFDERLPLFNYVAVTASGNWRWRVRGNVS